MKKKVPTPPADKTCDHTDGVAEGIACMAIATHAHWREGEPWLFICDAHAENCPHCYSPGTMFEPYCFHSWRPHTKLKAKCTKCQKQTPWMELLEEWGYA
jgi:hypothetical protein